MQIKKEILLFFTLVILCITLIMAADFSKKTTENCSVSSNSPTICCKTGKQNSSNTSPWNFITQGVLHYTI